MSFDNRIRYIETPGGEEIALVPRDVMDALLARLEDAADAAAADEAHRALAAGEDELVPLEMTERMVVGESPVKVWREHRGLSQGALAAAAGIGQSYLSMIESGRRDGPFKVMTAIARVLGVTLDDLAPASDDGELRDAPMPAKVSERGQSKSPRRRKSS